VRTGKFDLFVDFYWWQLRRVYVNKEVLKFRYRYRVILDNENI